MFINQHISNEFLNIIHLLFNLLFVSKCKKFKIEKEKNN